MGVFKKLILIAVILFSITAILFVSLPIKGNIPVLMYHYIGEEADTNKLFVKKESFEKQMWFLKKFGYNVISPDEYYRIKNGEKEASPRSVMVTFDDGYDNFYKYAFPVARKYEIPMTNFFIANHVKNVSENSVSLGELRELSSSPYVTVGSHGMNPVILTELDETALKSEIRDSKRYFEEKLNKPVDYYCYTGGHFNEEVIEEIKRAGYKMAFTTSRKRIAEAGVTKSLFTIPRIKITRTSRNVFAFWIKVSGIYDFFRRLTGH